MRDVGNTGGDLGKSGKKDIIQEHKVNRII